jgi:signal transduction histidine kinase
VQFERSLTSGLPLIQADREELRRAFINVLRNAIQAMNNVGRIVVRTQFIDGAIAVTIRDFGPGIPPEVRERLFEPNFSTKTDGMGLGLAIVKKTIDDLGGTIAIESVSGEGTTVSIMLPAGNDEAAQA